MNIQTMTPFAAAVYTANTDDRMALSKFVAKQKALHTRIGGLLQEALFDEEGVITGLDAVDVAGNLRIPISRPAKNSDQCGLDVSALAQTSSIIRRAIDERQELLVIEKFGELEQNGQGLMDEILQVIAAGIPLLIAVPEAALPLWQERSGEMGAVLPFSEQAFLQWWQDVAKHREG